MQNLEFVKFGPKNYIEVKPYFKRRPTMCCESSFLYHVLWAEYYETKFCMHDRGILWLQKIDYDDVASILPICETKDLSYNFSMLERYYNHVLGRKMKMYLVDEEALKVLEPLLTGYTVIEDVDSFDYIYDAEELRTLAGRKFSKKRNNIQCFLKEYDGCYEYRQIEEANFHDVTDYLNRWLMEKSDTDELHRLDHEDLGLENMLNHFSVLKDDVKIAGLYLRGTLSAFTVGSYEKASQMAVIHIEKAEHGNRGIYPFLSREFLIREFPDVRYVNREDDMGIPGLRQSKNSYYPIGFAKKYTLIQK